MNKEIAKYLNSIVNRHRDPYRAAKQYTTHEEELAALKKAKERAYSSIDEDYQLAVMILSGLETDPDSNMHRMAAALLTEINNEGSADNAS